MDIVDKWENLQEGELREFSFLRIDIVDHSTLVKENAKIVVEETLNCFKEYVGKRVQSHKGKVWSWSGDGGLCAFYENDKIIDCVICGIKLLENLSSFNLHKNTLDKEINIRIAIHNGNAKYRVDTGNVHSDAINFVAHLESRRAEINSIYISRNVFIELPSKLRGIFTEQSVFENIITYKYMPDYQKKISNLHNEIKNLKTEKDVILSRGRDKVDLRTSSCKRTSIKGAIGVVAPIVGFPTQFYSEIIRGIGDESCDKTQIILFNINKEQENDLKNFFGNKKFLDIVDGLINISVDIPYEDLYELSLLKFPIVNIHHCVKSPSIVGNIVPDASGFSELMEHLVEYHSCKDLILVTRPVENPMKLGEIDPYRKAKQNIFIESLKKNGIILNNCPLYKLDLLESSTDEISSCIIEIQNYTFEVGGEIYNKIRDRIRKNTALVCLADTVAIGFIQAAFDDGVNYRKAGIRITGFDNSYLSQFYKLSTIDYNLPLTGMLAYSRLKNAIENLKRTGDLLAPVEDPIPMKFVRRKSCCF